MGKTAVYVVITLERICKDDGLQCVVIVHTRELAYQVSKEFERFKTYLDGIHVELIYGGTPLPQQQARLKENPPHIIVACPGRLKLLIEKKTVDLSKINLCDRRGGQSVGENGHARGCTADFLQHPQEQADYVLFCYYAAGDQKYHLEVC